ncbi:MAG: DUF481 domain-containing protein [Lentisphaerae bacterium]|nr:DUF481 domain-containing protein [Lentisphaerota bacterium]
MRKTWAVVVVSCVGLLGTLSGDEVQFVSGDRLTGTVKSIADGKMVFESLVAGTVTLKMADIATFSTAAANQIALADGTVLEQPVAAAEAGYVAIPAQGQPVALAALSMVNPPKPAWKGTVSVGATRVRGNTQSDAASVGIEASRRGEDDRISLAAGHQTASEEASGTTASNWFAKAQYDYYVIEKLYLYGNARYDRDRIAGLDLRLTPGAGLGYQWIERGDLNLRTEAGLAYVYERYSEPDETRSNLSGRLAYHLDKTFNSHVKGFHNLEYIPSFEDLGVYLINADVGVRAAMTARLSLEAKAQLAYNSEPAPGREKEDLRYVLGVGWSF